MKKTNKIFMAVLIGILTVSLVSAQDMLRFSGKIGESNDSDGDGVPDSSDLCTDTYSGLEVDSDGCAAEQFCGQYNTADWQQGFNDESDCSQADWKGNEGQGGDCIYLYSFNYQSFLDCRRTGGNFLECAILHGMNYFYCVEAGAD